MLPRLASFLIGAVLLVGLFSLSGAGLASAHTIAANGGPRSPLVTSCSRTQCTGLYPGDVLGCNSYIVDQVNLNGMELEMRECPNAHAVYGTIHCTTNFTTVESGILDLSTNKSEDRGYVTCPGYGKYVDSRVIGIASGSNCFEAFGQVNFQQGTVPAVSGNCFSGIGISVS